jgi:hypothetical protein
MKKKNVTKLSLTHETIRALDAIDAPRVAGGVSDGCGPTYLTVCPTNHPTSAYNMCSGNRACLTQTTT